MITKWTVLIYADGNNDLEPEIYQALERILSEPMLEEIRVIIQVARAPQKLVHLLRTFVPLKAEHWEGVRRYALCFDGQAQIEDLGNINMADPYTLANFLTWGITNYPSEHIMCILSGHGAGFMGMLTDYTHNYPVIMSIKGLISAFKLCQKKTGKQIDVLVMDACYMSMIEVWYEFSLAINKAVGYLITSWGNTPIAGLPCHLIIRYLQNGTRLGLNLGDTLENIVTQVNRTCSVSNRILAVNLAMIDRFVQLKTNVNILGNLVISKTISLTKGLGKWHFNRPNYPLISLLDLDDLLKTKFSTVYSISSEIRAALTSIIVYPNIDEIPRKQNLGPSLYLPATREAYLAFKPQYSALLFSVANSWPNVLDGDQILSKPMVLTDQEDGILSAPAPMPIKSVIILILAQNPGLPEKQAWHVVENLGWSKPLDKELAPNL